MRIAIDRIASDDFSNIFNDLFSLTAKYIHSFADESYIHSIIFISFDHRSITFEISK